jgi:hypothetical protein
VSAEVFERVSAVNLGLSGFAEAIRDQGAPAVDVDWRPPADGDPEAVALLTRLWGRHGRAVAEANAAAVARIESARPRAVTVAPAREALPWLSEGRRLLHSGPPIAWDRVCDPQRRAMTAAVLFEGWAPTREAAAELIAEGAVTLGSGNEHGHVGPMTGVCSPSMPVWVVEDADLGVRACSTLNEGPGDTLWFGVGGDEAVARLRFFRDEAGPLLARLLAHCGPVDVFGMAAQGVQMGDELHMRSQATGNLLLRHLAPGFAALGGEGTARFLAGNHHFFLTLTMAAAKCASLAAEGHAGSTVVTLISRNGTDVGVQLAGLPGRWFTAEAAPVQDALLREGFTEDDAARDIGDSAVIECIGLGGMAVAAAPTVAAFFGGTAADTARRVARMAEITVTRSQRFLLPSLDGAGTPVGIDARMVVELGVTPQITTGVLHATSGAGQIGAGIAHQPVAPFRDALAGLAGALDAA